MYEYEFFPGMDEEDEEHYEQDDSKIPKKYN